VELHVATYGWVCLGWKRAPHPSLDLTGDHRDALARGGDGEVIDVLCRSCNASKGASS
jgi:hypothetical protein